MLPALAIASIIAVVWLLLLIATGFSAVTVSLGLLAGLYITAQR